MLAQQIINYLQSHWLGPAVRVIMGGRTFLLGEGAPRTEVVIHEPALLSRFQAAPSLVFGEAYMAGKIDVHGPLMDLLQGFYLIWPTMPLSWRGRVLEWLASLPQSTSRARAVANAQHHYDLGNDFYKLWLDPSLTYSCAYFLDDSDDLATAQQRKVALLCHKARLQPGQTLLDIGCGWGSLLFHAARHHGVHATGISPAREQTDHIETEARRRTCGDQVRAIHGEWRDLTGRFDRIISVGMFEHVGLKQHRAFFNRWRQLLANDGLSILHTIGRMTPQQGDPWIRKYIFPGGYLPTLAQLASSAAEADLHVIDVENLYQHYARTLAQWSANFLAVRDQVVAEYGEPFARMWWLYLQGAEAAFRWGGLQLWQVVMAKEQSTAWPLNREVNHLQDMAMLSQASMPA